LLDIAAVKRQHALLQGTLVAQGSFSVYDTSSLHRANGWPNRIGEDIVLTWAMLRAGGRTTFEPTALAFTVVPQTLRHFVRQRQRWASGMVEGLRDHGVSLLTMRRYFAHSIGTNYAFRYLDCVYTLGFIPGVALAFTGNFAIAGPMTLAVIAALRCNRRSKFVRQRRAFRTVGARPRRNILGFVGYLLFYPFLVAPIAFTGYVLELAGSRRVW
jgi:poly-beta-1,6-N-acetyl-D-glucosamine synthase